VIKIVYLFKKITPILTIWIFSDKNLSKNIGRFYTDIFEESD